MTAYLPPKIWAYDALFSFLYEYHNQEILITPDNPWVVVRVSGLVDTRFKSCPKSLYCVLEQATDLPALF